MDDLITDFIAETREGLEALDSELVRFEQSPDDPATLSGIFRLIHTIKGTCGFLGLMRLQTVAHAAENVLGAFRDNILPVTPVAVTAVLDTVDLIRELTDALAASGVEPGGDDSVLICRLEALLDDSAMPSAALEPVEAATAAIDTRALIEQLGGDATLDAAAEAVLGRLRTEGDLGALIHGADQDRLQAAVRDSLSGLARKATAGDAFSRALSDLAGQPLTATMTQAAFETVAGALRELDVESAAIDRLGALILAVPQPEPVAQAAETPAAEVRAPVARPAPPATSAARTEVEASATGQTIRVSVDALEHLMTVVSELVLIRNQLIQTLRLEPESPFAAPLNRLNQVTSELQEGVMTTRMQPISGAWAKLPRLVRDLAQDLGKSIELVMLGQDTELDRQVLELIKDPLTHMIRNAADHGLEAPEERRAAGKVETGRITLQARHEGGAIVIEVSDDGRGLPADRLRAKALASGIVSPAQAEQMTDVEARQLIFLPGLSTASEVTSVSGRGVGMDVVRTNIEKIGGAIELASVEGGGTCFTIRIPLTLTIVSALIVECCGERFAMPQSSLVELVSASDGSGRTIEYIDGVAVLRLRDRLLPLISLQTLLQLEPVGDPPPETCIIVARVGAFTFGVIVDRVFDTEEIVVKPVASVLRHLKLYSGATILGDGSVILILDLKGVSVESGAGQVAGSSQEEVDATAKAETLSAILVFRAANDSLKAAPLANVARIEELSAEQIEWIDGRSVIQYRGKLMPIIGSDAGPATGWEGGERRPLLVFARDDRTVGLLVNEIVDIVESAVTTDMPGAGAGALGGLIIGGVATELIDVGYYWRQALQEGEEVAPATAAASPITASPAGGRVVGAGAGNSRRLLLVDQSPFSQLLLQPLLAQAGYEVTVAVDPAAALSLYDAGEHFHLIMADTSDPAEARDFAAAFGRAASWHKTPLLSLAVHGAPAQAASGGLDRKTLLDAVSDALAEMEQAA
ncbi:MAG: chemotaxis protein CheA [Brevundimonas sp.]|uniref:chemotaxis protein CheA n=1 Tax=Brevundimonas sp. TaxID=1871086 RepID=UPI00271FA6E4|nr:chemotaxis protein CheA [Brevundimonas sp.]MDO9076877.1 chemotaxis protein CheA [Brevundimonas sp.]MDZ4060619.1 chemotaxis protein CheA [Brevundimonas sp.]